MGDDTLESAAPNPALTQGEVRLRVQRNGATVAINREDSPMRRIILTLVLLCLCAAASAATYRFRNGVVTEGDSVAAVIQRAGKPDRVVQLQNEYGAGVGERWEYYFGSKLVALVISDGRVISIRETF